MRKYEDPSDALNYSWECPKEKAERVQNLAREASGLLHTAHHIHSEHYSQRFVKVWNTFFAEQFENHSRPFAVNVLKAHFTDKGLQRIIDILKGNK